MIDQKVFIVNQSKPNYIISFHQDEKTIGTLDFNGGSLVFTGDAEESAKVFIGFVAQSFSGRLQQERNEAYERAANEASLMMTPSQAEVDFDSWCQGTNDASERILALKDKQ